MVLIWIAVALLVAAVTVIVLKKTTTRPEPTVRPATRRPARPTAAAALRDAAIPAPVPDSERPAAAPADQALPPVLADFHLLRADALPDDLRQAFVTAFKDVPRPPKLLHRLLSPDFVNEASAAQLVDLIVGEPLIAAKVLTRINSPMYGLKAPVRSIGQAVTYLGLNTVRSLCLQYILIASFKADSAERKHMLDAAWNASALASEPCAGIDASCSRDMLAAVASLPRNDSTTALTSEPRSSKPSRCESCCVSSLASALAFHAASSMCLRSALSALNEAIRMYCRQRLRTVFRPR